jgi:hypothetical protein
MTCGTVYTKSYDEKCTNKECTESDIRGAYKIYCPHCGTKFYPKDIESIKTFKYKWKKEEK